MKETPMDMIATILAPNPALIKTSLFLTAVDAESIINSG